MNCWGRKKGPPGELAGEPRTQGILRGPQPPTTRKGVSKPVIEPSHARRATTTQRSRLSRSGTVCDVA